MVEKERLESSSFLSECLACVVSVVQVNSAATEIEEVNYLISHFLSVSYDGGWRLFCHFSLIIIPMKIKIMYPRVGCRHRHR